MNNPLIKWSEIKGRKLLATDGEIGKITDILFDDSDFSIRYFVVHTGPWLLGTETLISPGSVREDTPFLGDIPVTLTQEQVRNAPPYESNKPVTRQYEEEYYHYHGYTPYWGGAVIGPDIAAAAIPPQAPNPPEVEHLQPIAGDPHLQSCKEIRNYSIMAQGEDVGFVDDFVFEAGAWKMRHMFVETALWPGAEKYLCPCEVILEINNSGETIETGLTRHDVEKAPRIAADEGVGREYEDDLYSQLKVEPYWQKAEGRFHDKGHELSPTQM